MRGSRALDPDVIQHLLISYPVSPSKVVSGEFSMLIRSLFCLRKLHLYLLIIILFSCLYNIYRLKMLANISRL